MTFPLSGLEKEKGVSAFGADWFSEMPAPIAPKIPLYPPVVLFGLLFIGSLWFWGDALGQEPGVRVENEQADFFHHLREELQDGFDQRLRAIAYGAYQGIAESTNNPNNDFFRLPGYLMNGELRLDLSLSWRRLALSAKPRMTLQWQKWNKGNRKGEKDWDDLSKSIFHMRIKHVI